jgi:hypothetical protein
MQIDIIIRLRCSLMKLEIGALVPAHHGTIAWDLVRTLALLQRRQSEPVSSLVDGVRPVDAQDNGDTR